MEWDGFIVQSIQSPRSTEYLTQYDTLFWGGQNSRICKRHGFERCQACSHDVHLATEAAEVDKSIKKRKIRIRGVR